MANLLRFQTMLLLLLPMALAAGLLGLVHRPSQTPTTAPSATEWELLERDGSASCPASAQPREVGSSWWAVEGDRLHLRLCTAAAPGWTSTGNGWTDARYKWRMRVAGRSYLLLVEDFGGGGAADRSDGRGEITLLDDVDGDGLFAEWTSGSPPAYVDNRLRSARWRRAESGSTGPSQGAAGRDVGFVLSRGSCGPVIDVHVALSALDANREACLSWATDDESPSLDTMPACDRGSGSTCVALLDPPTATAQPSPTRLPSATPRPPSPTPPPTATPPDTATPPATATIALPSATPTALPVVPTLSPTPAPSRTPTAMATVHVPSATPTPTAPANDATATPSATAPPPATRTASPTSTATATATSTSTEESAPATAMPTETLPASATATIAPSVTASPTAAEPSPTVAGGATVTPQAATDPPPTKTATANAPPTATALPTSTPAVHDPPTPTPSFQGELMACLLAEIDGGVVPFPQQSTMHALLLTPWGTPAKPAVALDVPPDGCAHFRQLEPGQYRVWPTVPNGWEPAPGSPPSHYLWVPPSPPGPRAVFRYQPCLCPGGPGGGGGVPTPPGPPTGIAPSPPGGTPPPGGGGAPPLPPGPPTAVPTPAWGAAPDRPIVGAWTALPVLQNLGHDTVCSTWVEVQNIGDLPAKALMIIWGQPGFCPPQCAGPLKVECSGLLTPGSAWNFLGAQVPSSARSGLVVSASAAPVDTERGADIFADALCETLFAGVVGDCNAYRRFFKAYTERLWWNGFDFGAYDAQPLAVEALRTCPGDLRPDVNVTASYAGVAGEHFGAYDPVYGGHAYFTSSLYAGDGGFSSTLYIQNVGLECTSVEMWFKATDDCLRSRICDILTLAPGESQSVDAGGCLPAGWRGSAWIRSSEPLAIAVDHVGNDVLMTYTGVPSELRYTHEGDALFTSGSPVAYGPLVYSEYQGWDTAIVVQNLSRTTAAKVKVYFQDRSGGIITTVADWVCAGGSQTFFLPVIADLPGSWVGSVRVESQDWFSPGAPAVRGPNVHAVAQLVHYSDVMRTTAQEAIAYTLFPEALAFDWQLGGGPGGTTSGVGRIGIPSFIKDRRGTGVTSELSIANIVPKPGFTNFAIFIFDQNGLLDYLCETLGQKQVEYVDLDNWGFIHPGFKGSAIISATYWEHDVFDRQGGFTRNLVGLAAVKVERSGTTLGHPVPGDEAAGNIGFPIPGPLPFMGPAAPECPGQPGGRLPSRPGQGAPAPTTAPPGGPAPPGPPPVP